MGVLYVLGADSLPAVSQQPLQDIGGSRCAEDGPLDASVFEVAAVDLMGTKPFLDSLLDTVALGKSHGAGSWGETVIHEVHRVLREDDRKEMW